MLRLLLSRKAWIGFAIVAAAILAAGIAWRISDLEKQNAALSGSLAQAMAANRSMVEANENLQEALGAQAESSNRLLERLADTTDKADLWRRHWQNLVRSLPLESCAYDPVPNDLRQLLDHPGCADAASAGCDIGPAAVPVTGGEE